jgi:hypothetical protein
MKVVVLYTILAIVIALVTGPIPGTSIMLSILEVVMCYHIARRHHCSLAIGTIGWGAVMLIGGAEVIKLAISTVSEFLPGVGWFIIKPGFAGLFVIVLGALAESYFKDQQRLAGLAQAQQSGQAASTGQTQQRPDKKSRDTAKRTSAPAPAPTQPTAVRYATPTAAPTPQVTLDTEPANYCPYCGSRVKPAHRFCQKCGAALN